MANVKNVKNVGNVENVKNVEAKNEIISSFADVKDIANEIVNIYIENMIEKKDSQRFNRENIIEMIIGGKLEIKKSASLLVEAKDEIIQLLNDAGIVFDDNISLEKNLEKVKGCKTFTTSAKLGSIYQLKEIYEHNKQIESEKKEYIMMYQHQKIFFLGKMLGISEMKEILNEISVD